jgi:hypothetical protein
MLQNKLPNSSICLIKFATSFNSKGLRHTVPLVDSQEPETRNQKKTPQPFIRFVIRFHS